MAPIVLRRVAAVSQREAGVQLGRGLSAPAEEATRRTPLSPWSAACVIAEKKSIAPRRSSLQQHLPSRRSLTTLLSPPFPGAPFLSSILSMPPSMRPLAPAGVLAQLQQAGRRSYATTRPSLIANRAQWTPRPVSHQIALRQSIRRQSTETPKPAPKKRFRLLRWTWRLTYISAIAGAAYASYGIWEMRNPSDQPPPDPTKKTLVVLGA